MKTLTRTIKSGNHLFRENDRSRELYIIQSGRVKVYRMACGKEVELANLSKGAVLGEMALIDGKPRSASAKAIDDCTVIIIDSDTFHQKIAGVPSWFMTIIRMTSQKIRQANQRLQSIRCEHQALSLIITLYYIYSKFSKEDKLDITSTQHNLIQLLGITHQKIITVIEFLNTHKFIEISDNHFTIPDQQRYAEYCDFLRLFIRKFYDKFTLFTDDINNVLMLTVLNHKEIVKSNEPSTTISGSAFWEIITKANLSAKCNETVSFLKDNNLLSFSKSDPKNSERGPHPLYSYNFKINNSNWKRTCLFVKYNHLIPLL